MSAKHALEHRLWQLIREENIADKKILIALSGGADSVALVGLLSAVLPRQQLALFHFHHGLGANEESRNQALQWSQDFALKLDLNFYFEKWTGAPLNSEDEFRKVRYEALMQQLKVLRFDFVATAHHANDLLETRLIRLIRGTGPQGLIAMKLRDQNLLRPLLGFQRQELVSYLEEKTWTYIQDPSNLENVYFRNWLRNEWLPQLETHRPGALRALHRSLESLAVSVEVLPKNNDHEGIVLSEYLGLSKSEQRRRLASYLLSLGIRDFSQSHLEEIQKRLDNPQKVLTFRVAGGDWTVNAERIQVEFLS